MINSLKKLAIIPFFCMLAACHDGSDVATLRDTPTPTTDKFQSTLVQEYKRAAEYEATTEGEWDHADGFARKGIAAANGKLVLPEDGVTSHFKVSPANPDLNSARASLMVALDNGGRINTPEACAKAQVKFDEWLEEIAEAEDGKFERAAYMKLAPACIGTPVAAAAAAVSTVQTAPDFTVYFAFDSAKLDSAAKQIVQNAASYAADHTDVRVALAGHTDTAGSKDYNIRLSLRRADAVRAEFIADGIPASRLSVTALGESQLAVPTAEGVREARNRRVVIDLK